MDFSQFDKRSVKLVAEVSLLADSYSGLFKDDFVLVPWLIMKAIGDEEVQSKRSVADSLVTVSRANIKKAYEMITFVREELIELFDELKEDEVEKVSKDILGIFEAIYEYVVSSEASAVKVTETFDGKELPEYEMEPYIDSDQFEEEDDD